ncbi:MAG: hypothetical protein IK052_04240, partial [Bacteroidales bacterium]|nr:hypothetical protein [Bacteroidales bacterium]
KAYKADFTANTARKSAFFLKNVAVSAPKTASGAFYVQTRLAPCLPEYSSCHHERPERHITIPCHPERSEGSLWAWATAPAEDLEQYMPALYRWSG